jgi:ubiquinone/menaquinone biosynthesis C-methylase UbiE
MASPTRDDSHAFGALEHAGWERNAEHYDRTFGTVTRQSTGPLLDAVRAGPGVRLLDVACGPGYLARAAAERGADALGLDFSAAMVRTARGLHPGVQYREGDAQALPLPDGAFHAVVCSFGMLHFPDPPRALAEARRVLGPGGRLAFTDWSPPGPDDLLGLVMGAVRAHGTVDVGLPRGPKMFQFSEPAYCARALTDAGFDPPELVPLQLVLEGIPAQDVVGVVLRGMVRTRALLEAQSPAARAAIEQAIGAAARNFESAGQVRIPVHAMLVRTQVPPPPRAG